MRCPFCAHPDTQVVETRDADEGVTRRRRRCLGCDRRFTTYEKPEVSWPTVVKRSGTRSEFNAEKLRASMALALRKRQVPTDLVEASFDRILDRVRGETAREVPTTWLGELVMEELKHLDKVAYVRFASVYRSFADVEAFKALLQDI